MINRKFRLIRIDERRCDTKDAARFYAIQIAWLTRQKWVYGGCIVTTSIGFDRRNADWYGRVEIYSPLEGVPQ